MCPSLVNPNNKTNNKDVAGNQEHQFKNKLDNFGLFFLAMDKCCDADDKMQLFIFVCGITKEFEIMDELAERIQWKKSFKRTNLFMELNAWIGLGWNGTNLQVL